MDGQDVVAAARAALEGFMAAFNARDAEAIRTRWFHFPHVRFHSGRVTVLAGPQDYRTPPWAGEAAAGGWARSAWELIEPIDWGPDKVHFRVRFARHRADGSLIGSFPSLYIVTRLDGRWAIQGRSSWAA